MHSEQKHSNQQEMPTPVTHVEITEKVINLDELMETISHPSCGAISSFSGITRNFFQGKLVHHLEYEAYTSMAEKVLGSIATEMRRRWYGIHGIAIVHRIGTVAVGETSVLILVSSPHRKDSLESVTFAIDAIKAFCPIWKKEIYSDGSVWKENSEASVLMLSGMNLEEFEATGECYRHRHAGHKHAHGYSRSSNLLEGNHQQTLDDSHTTTIPNPQNPNK